MSDENNTSSGTDNGTSGIDVDSGGVASGSDFGNSSDALGRGPVNSGGVTDAGGEVNPVDPAETNSSTVSASDGESDQAGEGQSPAAGGLTIAPPAADPEGDARRQHIHNLVEEWWSDHFPGSVVGRSVEIWNYVHGAKDALKTKLDRWLTGAPTTEPPAPPATE